MSIFSYFKRHAVVATVVCLAVVCIVVIAARAAHQAPAAGTDSNTRKVTLVPVSSFRNGSFNVAADGVVEAHSQADLRSQVSAPVAVVNAEVGDTVYPGQVILELANADIRAQLSQTQAALQVSQGQQYTGAVSLTSAKQAVIDKLQDAYLAAYNAVNTDADPILYNNDGNGGRLVSYSSDAALNNEITALDIDLKGGFGAWKKAVDALTSATSTDAIERVVGLSKKNMTETDQLLGDISKVLNTLSIYAANPAFSASLATWKGIISGARSALSGATQALTGADTALSSSNASQNTTAGAGVSAATAAVSNLQAQLDKTIIRSPIAGKIASLPLRPGELAQPGTLLVTVVGDTTSLEVKAYASGDDLPRIKLGQPALIAGTVKGTVSNVAPSIDSTTRKAEVDVDVTDSAHSGLVIGQNVSVSITTQNGQAAVASGTPVTYVLPIQDVKIIPGDAYVFTVDATSKIVKNPVILGPVQGDFIQVVSGLTDDMSIVSPVYELDEGQTVTVQ